MLSLDPGTHKLGWCLWDKNNKPLDWGVIKASKGSTWERIASLIRSLHIRGHEGFRGGAVCLEEPVGSWQQNSTWPLALITGALAGHFWTQGATVFPYNANTVKSAVIPRGAPRTKDMARRVIESEYPELADAPEDAIDAVAVGICHINHMREKELTSGRCGR